MSMSEAEAEKYIVEAMEKFSALPYLFLGSGISLRYLGLPTWRDLLEIFAEEAGLDIDYLCATHDNKFEKVAQAVAEEFHEVWWKSEKYEKQKFQYKHLIKDKTGALKVAVSEYLKSLDKLQEGVPGVDHPELKQEVKALGDAVIDGVITTNYDTLTRQMFPRFDTYVGQDELLFSDAQFVAEAYQIHGSVLEPISLVLTESDYERFGERNAYLAAKLLTIFVEHPVLFIGYSLNDSHLREILEAIANAAGENRLEELGQRIYFVEWNRSAENEVHIETTSLGLDLSRFPITRIETSSFEWIWRALGRLHRPFPGTLIRELKKNFFEIVANAESAPRDSVVAVPIDSELAEGQKVVFGIGGYSGIDFDNPVTISQRILQREDILNDVLDPGAQALSSETVLLYGVSQHLRARKDSYIPVWKYLHYDGRINDDGSVDQADLPLIIMDLAHRDLNLKPDVEIRAKQVFGGSLPDPDTLFDSGERPYFIANVLPWLVYYGMGADEFAGVLKGRSDFFVQTEFAKLVMIYDRLKYSPYEPKEIFTIKSTK